MELAPTAGDTSVAGPKLFGLYSFSDVSCSDLSLTDYIAISGRAQVYTLHSAGRWQKKRFRKAQCPIVERLVNAMMKHGRNNGKKIKAIRAVKDALVIIHLTTERNPIEVVVDAIRKAGCREDATRIGASGVVRRQAVDVSPLRRVNTAIDLLTTGARKAADKSTKTIAECLADEIINCRNESANSYAIKKKDEIERVAKANR